MIGDAVEQLRGHSGVGSLMVLPLRQAGTALGVGDSALRVWSVVRWPALVLLVTSAGFAFYVAHFAAYNRTYGAVAGVIVFLVTAVRAVPALGEE